MATESAAVQSFIENVLARLMARRGESQLFLFGSAGDPFWAARKPLTREELHLLEVAVDRIASDEQTHAKPFVGRDPADRFTFAALAADSDLYVVLLAGSGDGARAEARVVALRTELLEDLGELRKPEVRRAPQA